MPPFRPVEVPTDPVRIDDRRARMPAIGRRVADRAAWTPGEAVGIIAPGRAVITVPPIVRRVAVMRDAETPGAGIAIVPCVVAIGFVVGVADVSPIIAREHQAVLGFGVFIDGADRCHASGKPEPTEVAHILADEHAAAGEVPVFAEFPLTGEDGDRPGAVIEAEILQRRERIKHIADIAVIILFAEEGDRRWRLVRIIREGGRGGKYGGHREGDDGAQGKAAHWDSFRPRQRKNGTLDMNRRQHSRAALLILQRPAALRRGPRRRLPIRQAPE